MPYETYRYHTTKPSHQTCQWNDTTLTHSHVCYGGTNHTHNHATAVNVNIDTVVLIAVLLSTLGVVSDVMERRQS